MADVDYIYLGTYHAATFQRLFTERFKKNPRYNSDAIPAMMTLVDMIGRDPNVADVRWGAYMLATVFWEPLLDKKGTPIMLKRRTWLMTMAPVDEVGHGKGRRYHEPVKVAVQTDGAVRVTEQDGDQFAIGPDGSIKKLTKNAKMGTTDGGQAVKAYEDDAGVEHAYYGRGYVQLTWWSNYATSGLAIGKGLDLLLNPEMVKDPAITYAIMSHGMRTGTGFANGRKFSDYFVGPNRDYIHARKRVNGKDHADDIAKIAEAFETILMASRVGSRAAPAIEV